MGLTIPTTFSNLWSPERAHGLTPLEALAYRSNLLAADRALVNYGGGNTSSKLAHVDHTGKQIEVLWVKGSGSDLADIRADGFTGLRLVEVLPLAERAEMSDADMVAYLGQCQLDPKMPRSSIETLLHAFVPHAHVDHTHPDSIGAIVGAVDGERLAEQCFEGEAIWIPYLRPGFALSKLVAAAVAARPDAKLVLLAKHGLVTWGDTPEACYASTLDAVNRAAAFVDRSRSTVLGSRPGAAQPGDRDRLLAAVLPALRGAVAVGGPRILQVDTSAEVVDFVRSDGAAELSQVGAACPDHLVHTKRRPLWVEFDPEREGADELRARLVEGVRDFQEREHAYFEANRAPDDVLLDPSPRVVLIQRVGLVSVGRTLKAARLSRDLYHRAIAVMNGASALGGFVSLTDAESYGVEYWPLELYKLSLAPPPREFQGAVVLITGAAGGIGAAIAHALAELGACVVLTDIDAERAHDVAATLGDTAVAIAADVTDESSVQESFCLATLAFGGVDIVVSNAGIASSAPIEQTTVELWERNHSVLARGYFLVAREAAATLRAQGTGGSIVFIGSKNALVPGKGASAYSSAKAAELHLARCLAEELGPESIRVNTVNPDAVLEGSRIWDSSWREERARAYGIEPEELEEHYRRRTTLKVSVGPDDVAEAVLHFASPARSGKSTGNVLNVDGGVSGAYPR